MSLSHLLFPSNSMSWGFPPYSVPCSAGAPCCIPLSFICCISLTVNKRKFFSIVCSISLVHTTLCTCVSVLLAHIPRSGVAASKGSCVQKTPSRCILCSKAVPSAGETSWTIHAYVDRIFSGRYFPVFIGGIMYTPTLLLNLEVLRHLGLCPLSDLQGQWLEWPLGSVERRQR